MKSPRMNALIARVRRSLLPKSAGFTLVELMIVVAITAILAAIALPAYQKQVRESHRASAKTALLDVASREERYYATNNNYTNLTGLGYSSSTMQVPSATQNYYNVTVSLTNSNANFTATAAPTGNQSSDACGSYSVTDLGVQSVTGSATNCW